VTVPAFDARELFRALARHEVAYVTVGGIAVQAHGGQRLTQDLDVVVAADAENIGRLAMAVAQLDARVRGPEGRRSAAPPTRELLASGDQWHLTSPHGDLDVVFLPARLGRFEDLRERALEVPLGELVVPIAAREDLITMKRAAGRPQDLTDVELLEGLDDDPR
jgi:hypothetical protein